MGTRNSHGIFVALGDGTQQLRPFENGNPPLFKNHHFGVGIRNSGGVNRNLDPLGVLVLRVIKDLNALLLHSDCGIGSTAVVALNRLTVTFKYDGKGGHADASDAYEIKAVVFIQIECNPIVAIAVRINNPAQDNHLTQKHL